MLPPDENAANLSNDAKAIYQVRDKGGLYYMVIVIAWYPISPPPHTPSQVTSKQQCDLGDNTLTRHHPPLQEEE